MKLLNRIVDAINDRGPFIFFTPCVSVIGNCSEELVFGLLRARRENKKLVVLRPYELPWKFRFPITNREIFNLTSPFHAEVPAPIRIFLQLMLTAIYGPFHVLSRLLGKALGQWAHLDGRLTHPNLGNTTLWMPTAQPAEFHWGAVDAFDWPQQIQKPLSVGMRPDKRALAHAIRLEMGIPEDAWFVGLHVRERGFYNPTEEITCRNATIANYIPAIREITDRGGWVVRLGDKTMTPLPPMERVIDYPHTRFKSDLMDMHLIGECRFYIGIPSGILDTAFLFQRPTLIMNMTTTALAYPRRRGDRGIMKHIYSKSKKRFFSVKEILESPWETQIFYTLGDDIEMFENSPEELREAVVEFMRNLDDGIDAPTPLQAEANRIRIEHGRQLLSRVLFADHYVDMHNRYRLASRLESSAGSLSQTFLEKHWTTSGRNVAAAT
ncbi:MAG: TIGR04372 family glycosyltransferase [Elusimicrobia bacterium]|nr:TIGR04372 family glycosyltransferase [Elusimicrobiota bacterium]